MGALVLLVTAGVGVAIGAWGSRWRMRASAPTAVSPSFSNILTSLDTAYFWRDVAQGHEECSVRLCQMLGLDDYAKHWSGLLAKLPELARQSLQQALEEVQRDKNVTMLTMSLDDGARQIEATVTGVRAADDTVAHLIIWFRDVTATQRLQARLAKEHGQLKSEVKQLSSILNLLPAPVWLRTADMAIRYCNMAYSEAAEESVTGKGEHEMPELYPQSKVLAASALEANEQKSERRHIVVNGARKLLQFTEIPMKSDGIVVGLAQDITDLETAKEELQRYINAQSDLLESVTSAIAVFGVDQRIRFFNNAYAHLWALDEVWLNTKPTYSEVLEVLREKRRLPEQANFPQFKQRHVKLFTDLIEPREEIFYLPDGRTLRVLAIPHALGGILFAYEDVTDRLALERSYNTLIAVQKATLDNLHEGVVVFGEDGRLRLYNPQFLRLWKLEHAVLSPETHIADLIEKTRSLHHAPEWKPYKQEFIANLQQRVVQYRRMERTDGSVVDSVVVPLPDGATLITFSDVTDSTLVERSLRERNEALQQADRLKTEFLANVSYELRSPLTSIIGFSEILTQAYFGELSAKQREYVGGIYEASQNLMHLINDILDIASVEAGYMKLDVSEFNIHTMLQSVVSLVHERIREHKLEFMLHCPRRIGMLLGDETRIKQILFNLLSNAIKYSHDGGKIEVSAEITKHDDKTQEAIIFTVQDHGIGISPEEQEAIFGKFHKGSSAAGALKSGAGLGLSVVKSFVELHGGRVELTSAPEKGTTVTCTFLRRNPNLLEFASPKVAAAS